MFFLSFKGNKRLHVTVKITRKYILELSRRFDLAWGNKREFGPFSQDIISNPIRITVNSNPITLGVFTEFVQIGTRADSLYNKIVPFAKYFTPEFDLFYVVFDC